MKGCDLLREPPTCWGNLGSALLLNPRLDSARLEIVCAAEFPEFADNVWMATSGTSGQIKIVALSHEALEASAAAVNQHLSATSSDCWLNPLPLFHVGGLGIVVRAALTRSRCEFLSNWNAQEFASRAKDYGATLTSLVPAQVHDILGRSISSPPTLRAVVVGGGALDETLRIRAAELGWPLLPSYGMTETASQVATARPGADDFSWLPLLDHFEARVGEGGVLELRGSSLLTGWMLFDPDGSAQWEDPKTDGWFRTSDRAELRNGQLHFIGRGDDLVKIRGELVDVAGLERELQMRVSSGLVRIDVEPDDRNGSALTVVAENAAAEAEVRGALDVFPPYARPAAFRVGPVAISPLGKKIRRKNISS